MEKFFITYCHNVQIDWFTAFANYLKENRSIRSVCIVQGEEDFLRAKNTLEYDIVLDILEGFDYKKAKLDFDKNINTIKVWEKGQKEGTFFQDVYQDRWLSGRFSYEYIIHFSAHIIRKLSSILEKYPPLASVGEKNSLPYRIFHHYSKLLEFPHFTHLATRHFPKDRFYLEPDIYWRWPKINKIYKDYLSKGIPKELISIAEDKYKEITEAHLNSEKKLVKRGVDPIYKKLKLRHLREFIVGCVPISRHKKLINPRFFRTESLYKRVNEYLSANRSKRYFDKLALKDIDLTKKICTYFLHLQPEYTIDGLGFSTNNQIELIKTIAGSIPSDYILYVKEHRVAIGVRGYNFYQQLNKLPNVRLVSDNYDGHKLVKNSDVVFTVTGTVGLEALYHQIPVIVFGEIFYKGFHGITKVNDMRFELYNTIKEMIMYPEKYTSTKENALSIIAAMWYSGHDGCINPIFIDESQIPKSPNKEKLGKGLVRELEYLGIL